MHPTINMTLEEAVEFLLNDLSKALKAGADVGVVFKGLAEDSDKDFVAALDPNILRNPLLMKQTLVTVTNLLDQHGCTRWIFGGYVPHQDMVFVQYGDRRTETSLSTARKIERLESGAFNGFGPEMMSEGARLVSSKEEPKMEPEVAALIEQSKGATKH